MYLTIVHRIFNHWNISIRLTSTNVEFIWKWSLCQQSLKKRSFSLNHLFLHMSSHWKSHKSKSTMNIFNVIWIKFRICWLVSLLSFALLLSYISKCAVEWTQTQINISFFFWLFTYRCHSFYFFSCFFLFSQSQKGFFCSHSKWGFLWRVNVNRRKFFIRDKFQQPNRIYYFNIFTLRELISFSFSSVSRFALLGRVRLVFFMIWAFRMLSSEKKSWVKWMLDDFVWKAVGNCCKNVFFLHWIRLVFRCWKGNVGWIIK